MKLGAAGDKAAVGWRLEDVKVEKASAAYTYTRNGEKRRKVAAEKAAICCVRI